MNAGAVIVVPFVVWHSHRAIHALRTGKFQSLGSVLDRASAPDLFWFRVAREFLLATLFGALFVSLLLGLARSISVWLFGGCVVVYAAIILTTITRRSRGT